MVGGWWWGMQKRRVFEAGMLFPKNGGLAPEGKNADSHEKSAIAMVLPPANDPDPEPNDVHPC